MTKYVIQLVGGFYLKDHPTGLHWTVELEQAMTFETMTGANAYAIMRLGLGIDTYEVIPVHVPEPINAYA